MVELTSTVAGIFIGASSSILVVVFKYILDRRRDKRVLRETLARNYLIQFQESLVSLLHRLVNVRSASGRDVMQDEYYEVSTLYVLGCVLAYQRIFLLDGVYVQLEGKVVSKLKGHQKKIESEIVRLAEEKEMVQVAKKGTTMSGKGEEKGKFSHRYNRLALAEAVIERGSKNLRITPYLTFKERYEAPTSNLKAFLFPAKHFVESLEKGEDVDLLLRELKGGADLMAEVTGVDNLPMNIESDYHQY